MASGDLVPVPNADGTGWHLEPPKPACPVREAAQAVVDAAEDKDYWAAYFQLEAALKNPCPTCHGDGLKRVGEGDVPIDDPCEECGGEG